MLRGDVWDVQFPDPVGRRPCVALTTNPGKLRRHRGRLSPTELRTVAEATRLTLDLE